MTQLIGGAGGGGSPGGGGGVDGHRLSPPQGCMSPILSMLPRNASFLATWLRWESEPWTVYVGKCP